MQSPQAHLLPDGRRLHLHHGPIDLILEVFGPARDACYAQATARFQTVLEELVAELPGLRRPLNGTAFQGATARCMAEAARRVRSVFVTPMAAVAGAVADEVLSAALKGHDVPKAYANNGGDIAFHLAPGEDLTAASAAGSIRITASSGVRGLATSGWQGRSHSLGIADAVTVAAPSAAMADLAATLIANAVDLPGHPTVSRRPARILSPDSDLGDRPVTVDVGPLTGAEIAAALSRGADFAKTLADQGLIAEASLNLQGTTRLVTTPLRQKAPLCLTS
ncbi:UPF0280 family protein [Thalassococcus sp. S3]|uniref:UPF0280 family protein n=1 Tax=Thalassococcus sp. S3 TaxID=2017482 RepID=UPI0010243641|nr:UPF0280 family protein [Thalassococcus sp. S3]QBF32031.1 hypothetical protein CFI11_12475 [Thalassococcus sp. S3]